MARCCFQFICNRLLNTKHDLSFQVAIRHRNRAVSMQLIASFSAFYFRGSQASCRPLVSPTTGQKQPVLLERSASVFTSVTGPFQEQTRRLDLTFLALGYPMFILSSSPHSPPVFSLFFSPLAWRSMPHLFNRPHIFMMLLRCAAMVNVGWRRSRHRSHRLHHGELGNSALAVAVEATAAAGSHKDKLQSLSALILSLALTNATAQLPLSVVCGCRRRCLERRTTVRRAVGNTNLCVPASMRFCPISCENLCARVCVSLEC